MVLNTFREFRTNLDGFRLISAGFQAVTGGLEGRRALLPLSAALIQRDTAFEVG